MGIVLYTLTFLGLVVEGSNIFFLLWDFILFLSLLLLFDMVLPLFVIP